MAHRIVDMRSDPEELCSCTEIYGFVEKEIQRLPEKTQSAFRLHEIDGLSITESSRVLVINKNGFKSQMFRARRKLKDALQQSRQAPVHVRAGRHNAPTRSVRVDKADLRSGNVCSGHILHCAGDAGGRFCGRCLCANALTALTEAAASRMSDANRRSMVASCQYPARRCY